MDKDNLIWLTEGEAVLRDAQLMKIPEPLLRIEFHTMTSWNDVLGMSRRPNAVAGIIESGRRSGREKALFYAPRYGGKVIEWETHEVNEKGHERIKKHSAIRPVMLSGPLKLTLRFWRATWAEYDVFSPVVKGIVDGFVEAGVMENDNYRFVPGFETIFMGIDPSLKPSAEAKAARKVKRAGRKSSLPMPARYWFDFTRPDS